MEPLPRRARAYARRPDVRRAALRGVLTGVLAVLVFLTVHMFVVEPVWAKAAPEGAGVVLVAGSVMGVVHHRLRARLPGRGASRGALWGALVVSLVLPFLVAGVLRTAGHSPLVWLPVLGALGAAWVALVRSLVGWGRVAVEFAAAAALVNALPAGFLLLLGSIVTDRVPMPLPMFGVLAAVQVGAGVVLEGWAERHATEDTERRRNGERALRQRR